MTIMITGGTGFIGIRVARALVARKQQVLCLDYAPNRARLGALGGDPAVTVAQGDTTHVDDLVDAIRTHGVRRIVHLAALLPPQTEDEPRLAMRINVMGHANVLEAARQFGVERVVYASSLAAFGTQADYGDRPVTDDDPVMPYILYGHTKVMNEVLARQYTRRYGLDTRGLRPTSVFGYGRETGRSAEVARLICRAAIDGAVTATQPPEQTSSLIHVDDIVEMFVRLCLSETLTRDVYLSGGTTASLQRIADIVRGMLPDARIDFPKKAALYPNLYNTAGAYLARDIQYQYPDLETRIRDTINEARRENGLPGIG
jgi:UDP-glucose 4-epimerase